MEDFKIEDIGSIKKIDDDLANPILMTFESSKFLGRLPEFPMYIHFPFSPLRSWRWREF